MIGQKTNRLIGAILLVSGTTIGAGMLALPVTTGLAGFIPSLVVMTAVWLFMMLTALYLLEVNLRLPGEANLISMMRKTLGKPGEAISWAAYLLLLYSLTAAYMLGASQILIDFLDPFIPLDIPAWIWPVSIFVVFAILVYFGTEVIDFLNRFLMLGLVAAYLGLVGFGWSKVDPHLLSHSDWNFILPSISVVLTTFGYHIIIPTLTTYLDHDASLLKKAILIGSFIPFVIYVAWQILVMGIVPVFGEHSLTEASEKGLQITFYLKTFLKSPWIGFLARAFAFFAIVTSLLGVSLSLSDFLADGFKIKKTHTGKFFLVLMTLFPPLMFALFYPQGFILALKYAGLFVVILLAFFPALMAWFERYRPKQERGLIASSFLVPGGKPLIVLTLILSVVLLVFEVVYA